jgi:hypothetical protein
MRPNNADELIERYIQAPVNYPPRNDIVNKPRVYIERFFMENSAMRLSARNLKINQIYLLFHFRGLGYFEKMYLCEFSEIPTDMERMRGEFKFKKICELKNVPENGKIPIVGCEYGQIMALRGNAEFIPISVKSVHTYIPEYFVMTEEQRIAASYATRSLPFDLQKHIFGFAEGENTIGPIGVAPSSVGETREDPLAEKYNSDENDEISKDTKAGRKSRRRKNRNSKKSKRSRRTRRRYRK